MVICNNTCITVPWHNILLDALVVLFSDHPEAFHLTQIDLGDDTTGTSLEQKTTNLKVHIVADFDESLLLQSNSSRKNDSSSSASNTLLKCDECGLQSFQSRNALFKHIRNTHRPADITSMKPNSKSQDKCCDQLLQKVKCFFRENKVVMATRLTQETPSPRVPMSYLIIDRKLKSAIRVYLRSLPMDVLPVDQRFEFETPAWWESAALHMLLAMKHSKDFHIHNYDFTSASSSISLDCDTSLKNVLIQCFLREEFNQSDSLSPKRRLESQKASHPIASASGLEEDGEGMTPGLAITFDEINILYQTPKMIFVNKPEKIRMESLVACCNCNLSLIKTTTDTEINQSHSDIKYEGGPDETRTYIIDSVSRLDQPTSGVVALPLSLSSERVLTLKFKNREVDKYYVCIVVGDLRSHTLSSPSTSGNSDRDVFEPSLYSGEINLKLRHVQGQQKTFIHPAGKISVTKDCCVSGFTNESEGETNNSSHDSAESIGGSGSEGNKDCQETKHAVVSHSLVVCKPVTGRTHQIRAHMAHIGFPLLGDLRYDRRQDRHKAATMTQQMNDKYSRLMLHSHQVKLTFSPAEQEACAAPEQSVTVTAPLPPAMLQACRQLAGTVAHNSKEEQGVVPCDSSDYSNVEDSESESGFESFAQWIESGIKHLSS